MGDFDKRMEQIINERTNFNQNIRENNRDTIEFEDNASYQKGMPLRSQFTIKKPIKYDKWSNHLKKGEKCVVNDYDVGKEFAPIKTSMDKISSQVDPKTICSNEIEKLTCNIFNEIIGYQFNGSFLINGIGLYSNFSSLYIVSNGVTEIELKNYFNFPKKETLVMGLSEILNTLYKNIKMINMWVVGGNVPCKKKYQELMNGFNVMFKIDGEDLHNEVNRLNYYVYKTINKTLKRTFILENLSNLQLMFACILCIKPIIYYDRLVMINGIQFLKSYNNTYNYFEDESNEMLEIANNGLAIGFIKPKKKYFSNFNSEYIRDYFTRMKQTNFYKILIPNIIDNIKVRLTSLLKLNIHNIFKRITSNKLFPESVVLQDSVQNTHIEFYKLHYTTDKTKYHTTRIFKCDCDFIYYIRNELLNLIFTIGIYKFK